MGGCALLLLVGLFAFSSAQTVHKMAIRSDVRFRFATTEVTCIMGNNEDLAQELFFDFTLPKDAFISNFSMEIEGKVYHGDVKEKEKARKQYLQAKETGSTGGLVEQSTRHSNKFDVSVNIAAGGNVTFKLLYQELLRRRFGVYEHSIFLDPSQDIRDFSVEVHVQELTEIKDVRTPALRKDIINNDVEEETNTMTQITFPTATSAHVVYNPSPKQKSGWFVVQYDIDAKDSGELLVVDGYFIHFFLPPDDLPPLPLDIVFVLDISGSMAGRKMRQLKDAMSIILKDLRDSDHFNILLFDGEVQYWQQELQDASGRNRELAAQYVRAIQDRGSTNLHRALMEGLKMLQGSREKARIPMIFFLTDGEPTAGVQNPKEIVSDVSRKNEGVVNIYSLAFGDGADYNLLRQISAKNKGFARKIYEASDAAKQVTGLYREISTVVMRGLSIAYESSSNSDTGGDPKDIIWVDNSTITTCVFPTLFGRSDLVVAGKLENAEILNTNPENAGGLRLKVSGHTAVGEVSYVLEENNLPSLKIDDTESSFWTVPRDLSRITERAWAFLTIQQLVEKKVAADADEVKRLDKKILELSLKYHFVTPLTSMVVTRPEDDINKGKENSEASLLDDDEVRAKSSSRRHHMQGSVQNPLRRQFIQRAHLASSAKRIAALPLLPHHVSRVQTKSGSSFQIQPSVKKYMSSGLPGLPGVTSIPRGYGVFQHMPTLVMYTTMTSLPMIHRRTTTTTTTTLPTPVWKTETTKKNKRRKGKKHKGKKNSAGRKRCVRNKKVLLESITISGEQILMCYELKAVRKPYNYTILADPNSGFSVTIGMIKKTVTSLRVRRNNTYFNFHVGEDGRVYFTGVPGFTSHMVFHPYYLVTVRATRHKCRATVISLDVKMSRVVPTGSVVRGFQGFAAKVFKAELKKSKRSKRMDKGKKRKKSAVPKKCMANNIPADRSLVLRGRHLMRFKA